MSTEIINDEIKSIEIINNEIKGIIQNNLDDLDYAKPHTQYKIKYIKDYVKNWLIVAIGSKRTNINFIDCMCNAGVYKNGYYCTCIEVLLQYKYYAGKYPNKNFNLYLNDINTRRINILKMVINIIGIDNYNNINIFYENRDVVDYLNDFGHYKIDNWNSFNLLYVDPYNFGINNLIDVVYNFLNNNYCELFYNFFSSDIKRNINNKSTKLKSSQIKKEIKGVFEEFDSEKFDVFDLMLKVQNKMKSTKNINYSFSYQFKGVEKNVELYYIMFFTPHIKGLDCVKKAIWKVFKGEPSFNKSWYCNSKQLSLFDTEEMLIQTYSDEVKPTLLKIFRGKKVTYKEIEEYILENTLLRSGQIKKYILKPMINDNKIIKKNIVSKANYEKDLYIFNDVL